MPNFLEEIFIHFVWSVLHKSSYCPLFLTILGIVIIFIIDHEVNV